MSYFKCPKCKEVVKRDGRQRYYRGKSHEGFCLKLSVTVRMKRVKNAKGDKL